MRYVKAKYKEYIEAYAYRVYVCDSIYNFTHGKVLDVRYTEVLNPTPQSNKTGDEIVEEIMSRAGLKFKEA